MNNYEINLKERVCKSLGFDFTAKKIFKEVNEHENVVLNFKGVEFMSMTFAQAYVFYRNQSKSTITEINMCEFIEKLVELIQKEYDEYYLNQ